MKKTFFSLLLLTGLSSYAQYTAIPDLNFEKALIAQGIDSGIPDRQVLTSKINTITNLNVNNIQAPNNRISDLTGIQDFTALRILNCFYNNLTNLDISNNTKLKELYCTGNKLTTIDVSKNLDLTNFFCDENQLTSVNVSLNTKLLYFGCRQNKLTTLDISKNLALITLFFEVNQLTTIDISKNLFLEQIGCSNNKLTSLNTTINTALTKLLCNDNAITSLDVTKNIKLQVLNFNFNQLSSIDVSKNIFLYELQCGSNFAITSLDFSNNINLVTLNIRCEGNLSKLSYLNLKNGNNLALSTPDLTTSSTNLTCIQVDNAAYSTTNWLKKDATAFYSENCSAPRYTLIPDLNFEKVLIARGIDSGAPDGKVLTSSIVYITSLNASMSGIRNLTGIEDFKSLTILSIDLNNIGILDLSKNIALQSLGIHGNNMTTLDVSRNINLTSLRVGSNALQNLDVSKNIALTELVCFQNNLTTLDLTSNVALTSLQCNYNKLTSLSVSKNTALISLSCDNNLLTSLDVSTNKALKSLYCNNNLLTSLNVSNNTSLTSINCSSNQLTSLDISKNLALIYLESSKNQLTSLNILNNLALKSIRCNDNKLTSLYLKNGKNTNFTSSQLNFKNNLSLTCIDVDNVIYSNTNWATAKDAIASYSIDCNPIVNPSVVFYLYPNPTTGMLFMSGNTRDVKVYNQFGSQISNFPTNVTSGIITSINLSSFPKGIYFVHQFDGLGNTMVSQVILQ